ncbi:alpha/beta hydrolase [Achromobacter ruhlandii]|nr:alpha/beta hydrolase-fold protein [Achromobacter ruhlandii]MCZ8431345.1 alpha/beta hydrolase-fold protein [Achromobacter ruhlandii]MDC6091187.1 alpha/beta hydrolase-fold protein [Achromobacter ruhlandii]MDC6154127.1 alpha/beta hydrolase-fold protein [Achromobacter ruhlandii]MDD7979747.1 alpha/beta hydrolase-fold protein [Achromobacter ruhlandii]WIW05929.1 alpha/beta hydrolase-fold protein [Achromobacter ruhlandii]
MKVIFPATAILAASFSFSAVASEVLSAEVKSPALGRALTYNVYLPTGYTENTNVRYPVMYLLHGNGGNRNDWHVKGKMQSTVDELVAKGQIPPAIFIMPDANTNWYVDLKEKMETAFIEDLMPHVEKTYRTINAREGRVIGGLSMGGYGAIRFVLKYPEKFQAAALLSPAIYNPEPPADSSARHVKVFADPNTDGAYSKNVWQQYNYPALMDAFLAKGIKVPMYINSGDDDEFAIEADATLLYSQLRKAKQPAELRIVNGKHEWMVWETTLGDSLKYVFSTVQRPQVQAGK